MFLNKTRFSLFIFDIFTSIFNLMKDFKHISIAISPELMKLLEDGKYNKSKLIDSLLTEHFNQKKTTKK